MKREYKDYFQDILDSIVDIEEFTKNMDLDSFVNDRKTFKAVVKSVEIIGEAAKKIPDAIKGKYTSIEWNKMAGMRDKLIHEYFGIDNEILWQTVKEDIPPLKPLVEKVMKDMEKSEL